MVCLALRPERETELSEVGSHLGMAGDRELAAQAGADLWISAGQHRHGVNAVLTNRHAGRVVTIANATSGLIGATLPGQSVALAAEGDLSVAAARVASASDPRLAAGRDLVLDAAEETYELDAASYKRASGTFGSKKRSTREIAFERTVSGAQLSAASIELSAGRDVWPCLCAPPYDCSADATKVAGFQSRALTLAQGLDQAALFEWFALGPLNAALRGTALTLQASRPGVSFLVEGMRSGVQGALTVDPWLGAFYDYRIANSADSFSQALFTRYQNVGVSDVAVGAIGGGLLNRFFGLPMRQWSSTALGASRWSSPEAFVIQMNQDVLVRSLTAGFGSVPDYSKRNAEVQP